MKSVFKNIVLLFGFILICWKGIIPGWQEGRSDFDNYYTSAFLLRTGEQISKFYDNQWFDHKASEVGVMEGAKFGPFPPATAFLFLPLSFLNPLLARRIWLACNLILFCFVLVDLKTLSHLSWLNLLFLVSLFCLPITSNIKYGQTYFLITLFITRFLVLRKSKNAYRGSGLLGIAASLKYFPVVYLIYSLPKIKKQITMGFLLGMGCLIFLPVLVNGIDPYLGFFGSFWNHLNGDLEVQGRYSWTFQSLDVLLANLFIYDPEHNPAVLINAPILKYLGKGIAIVTIVVLIIRSFDRTNGRNPSLTYSLAVLGAAILIPAGATYHLLLILPAMALVYSSLLKQNSENWIFVSFFLLLFVACNIMPHLIPSIESQHVLNTLIHFPRLYALVVLFSLLYFQINLSYAKV